MEFSYETKPLPFQKEFEKLTGGKISDNLPLFLQFCSYKQIEGRLEAIEQQISEHNSIMNDLLHLLKSKL